MCSSDLRGDETAALVPHGWVRSSWNTWARAGLQTDNLKRPRLILRNGTPLDIDSQTRLTGSEHLWPKSQQNLAMVTRSRVNQSFGRVIRSRFSHSFIHQALPGLSCPTVDADAVLLFADRGRVYVTVWKPGLEVLRVSRCVLDYVTMDNAGGPHTCTAELKYAILRAG